MSVSDGMEEEGRGELLGRDRISMDPYCLAHGSVMGRKRILAPLVQDSSLILITWSYTHYPSIPPPSMEEYG